MSKPLAIDLFCGLSKPKFLLRAYPVIKKLVTRRAQYPDHVSLGVLCEPPRAVSIEFRAVRNLKNSILATCFACPRHVRIAPAQPIDRHVFEEFAENCKSFGCLVFGA